MGSGTTSDPFLVADLAITTSKLASGSITTTKLSDGSITTSKLADASVDTIKLINAAITTSKLADASVTDTKLATNSVATVKIQDNAVTTIKLADDSVTNLKIAADAVTTNKIMDGTIVTADLADNSVTTIKLGDDSITSAKILDGSITTSDVADASITFAKLANCASGEIIKQSGANWVCSVDSDTTYTAGTGISLSGANVISSSLGVDIDSSEIVDGSVSTADITNDAITTGKILDGTILFADFASNGCANGQIAKFNGSIWACSTDNDTTYSTGNGITIISGVVNATLGTDITSGEIVDGTIVGTDISPNSLDFTELKNTLTLDTGTTINLGANNLVANLDDTGDLLIQDNGSTVLSILDNGSFLHKNAIDSTAAFKVENAATTDLFNINTTANTIQIGDLLADGTGALLVLDTKNTAGDPTGTNGAMYYNSNLGKFRCFEGGTWVNCISSGGASSGGIKAMTNNVVGVAPNGGAQANNGMTSIPEFDISVPAGKTLSAQYNLSYNIGVSGWSVGLNFPDYVSGQSITGKTTWQNSISGGSTEGTWYTWAHTPSTPSFTRGVYDSAMAKTTENVIIVEVTWTNNTATSVDWSLEFGADMNFANASAIPQMNNGSSVTYSVN